MDFELVLDRIISEFAQLRLRWAVIGGVALGVLGTPRQTMDVDFLIHRDDLQKLDGLLVRLGYSRVYRSENVSQYRHPDARWGSLDCLHAFREVSLGMLERATDLPSADGKRQLRTARPEDVIGLKVQAMYNDAGRTVQEQQDIEGLMARYRSQLDWQRIEDYYDAFDLSSEAKALRVKYDNAD